MRLIPHSDPNVRETIKELRAFFMISQKRLAELTGVHANTIGNIEAGIVDLKWETLVRLARAFQVTPVSLVSLFIMDQKTRLSWIDEHLAHKRFDLEA